MNHVELLEDRRLFAGVDIWVDSSNTDASAIQTSSNHIGAENAIEDDASLPGKVLPIGQPAVPVTLRTTGTVSQFRFQYNRLRFDLYNGKPGTPGATLIKPEITYPASQFAGTGSGRILYLVAQTTSTSNGASRLVAEILSNNAVVASDAARFTVIKADLDADMNRDGVVSDTADEAGENLPAAAIEDAGALVLPNFDKDRSTGIVPDNWTYGDWDQNGIPEDADTVVNDNGDVNDLAELLLWRIGQPGLISNLRVTLELKKPVAENQFFSQKSSLQRVRVFLPTGQKDGDRVVRAGDKSILGPEAGNIAEFVSNPQFGQLSSFLLAGKGALRLGVEGLEQGASVDIVMTIYVGKSKIVTESVRFRVAPFVLNSQTQNVERSPGPTVAVANFKNFNGDELNADVRAKLASQYGSNLLVDEAYDAWFQDGYEVGYAQVPGKSIAVGLELVRARDRGGEQLRLLRTKLLRAGFGVNITILRDGALDFGSQDNGGGIEGVPGADGQTYFFHGAGMYDEHRNFFLAQGTNPELEVDVSWLFVGHVDEVVSVMPDGKRLAAADPELAYALLLWARQIDGGAKMLAGMNEGTPADGLAVRSVIDEENGIDTTPGAVLRSVQVDRAGDVWRGAFGVRLAVAAVMGIAQAEPESMPVPDSRNLGSGALERAGSFSAWLGAKRFYRIIFTSASQYRLEYRDNDSAGWKRSSVIGSTAHDAVFGDAKAYLLRDWWNEAQGDLRAGDRFTFTADPNVGVIEIPVAFGVYPYENSSNAYAFTTDHVNALVDGNTIVTGAAYGPKVDWDKNGSKTDILKDYVKSAYGKVFSNVVFADARGYHNGIGSLHCATNVQREIPTEKWWEMSSQTPSVASTVL